MSRASKMAKQLTENTEVEEVVTETEAADSLHPAARSQDDPKSMPHKSAMLAKMIGTAAAMDSEELLKYFNGMMAYHSKVGHGMGVDDKSASNKDTLNMKPSAATHDHSYGDVKMPTPHFGSDGQTQIHHPSESIKELIKQDIQTMFEGTEGLDAELKSKATILFEAAVEARVNAAIVELNEAYETALESNLDEITGELIEGLDQYLEYVSQEWLKENEVAVESALKAEMANDFIQGLTALLKEFNVNIDDEQVEIVEAISLKNDELEGRINDLLGEKAELESYVVEAEKAKVLAQVCEGLTLAESEKLRSLAEGVEADDLEGFTHKVNVLKESNFVKPGKKATITEQLEEVDPENKPEEQKQLDPRMNRYADAIARTTVKY